ncbi:SPL family radical SAM protein [Limnochorda pilosa]|uniref:Radical SAM protein n=1 Tax=Limnochorda pilosa TaxID=1555112 RepID=A0A0K2SQB7_LIMPI|nr:radical SAM protein [Limnochorda pilosa]BAS29320.1 radical SAM protein [Limnochorda pilosa]
MARSRVQYVEILAASALNRVQAPGMPFRWSLNPYRGCSHGCAYCYARVTHTYLDLSAGDAFSTRILIKRNMPELLEQELSKPSWQREWVALGTATDAYQPAEGRYRITRAILESLLAHRTPVTLVTKSPLVLRDLDLLAELHRAAGVRVSISLVSLDRGLLRAVEPGAPPPSARLEALRRLNEGGVPAGLMLAPMLPGLTDGIASLSAVVQAAHRAGAASLGYQVLRLCEGAREVYLERLAELLPDLEAATRKLYRSGDYAPRSYQAAIGQRLRAILRRYPIPGPHTVYPAPTLYGGSQVHRPAPGSEARRGERRQGEVPLAVAGARADSRRPVQTVLAW